MFSGDHPPIRGRSAIIAHSTSGVAEISRVTDTDSDMSETRCHNEMPPPEQASSPPSVRMNGGASVSRSPTSQAEDGSASVALTAFSAFASLLISCRSLGDVSTAWRRDGPKISQPSAKA